MKKIINGKKYDTETAILIGKWSNDHGCSDFRHCEEFMYLKKTGEYFIHGKGGAMSLYARSCGDNSYCGGSGIVPLTKEEALEWAENKMSVDDVEAHFGEVDE